MCEDNQSHTIDDIVHVIFTYYHFMSLSKNESKVTPITINGRRFDMTRDGRSPVPEAPIVWLDEVRSPSSLSPTHSFRVSNTRNRVFSTRSIGESKVSLLLRVPERLYSPLDPLLRPTESVRWDTISLRT